MDMVVCDQCGEPITSRVGAYVLKALVTRADGDGSTRYDLCSGRCLQRWAGRPPPDLVETQRSVAGFGDRWVTGS